MKTNPFSSPQSSNLGYNIFQCQYQIYIVLIKKLFESKYLQMGNDLVIHLNFNLKRKKSCSGTERHSSTFNPISYPWGTQPAKVWPLAGNPGMQNEWGCDQPPRLWQGAGVLCAESLPRMAGQYGPSTTQGVLLVPGWLSGTWVVITYSQRHFGHVTCHPSGVLEILLLVFKTPSSFQCPLTFQIYRTRKPKYHSESRK